MKIQINADSHIERKESLATHIMGTVKKIVGNNSDHVSRIEVHLSDQNSNKHGETEKRCLMEARLEGIQPIAVSSHAVTLDQAIEGATKKLGKKINSTLERQRDQRHSRTDPLETETEL
jgi:ribosome-associated translation inhibitor RaiA